MNGSDADGIRGWWFVGGLNLTIALISGAVSIAMAARPDAFPPDGVSGVAAVRFASWYVLARNVPLAVVTAWTVVARLPRMLGLLCVLLGLVQLGDALIGVHYGNPAQAGGPFLLGSVHLASAWWLLRSGHDVDAADRGRHLDEVR